MIGSSVPDSRFFLELGLADPDRFAFRSFNFRDRFPTVREFHLLVEPEGSPDTTPDATVFRNRTGPSADLRTGSRARRVIMQPSFVGVAEINPTVVSYPSEPVRPGALEHRGSTTLLVAISVMREAAGQDLIEEPNGGLVDEFDLLERSWAMRASQIIGCPRCMSDETRWRDGRQGRPHRRGRCVRRGARHRRCRGWQRRGGRQDCGWRW
jgi:hypothetical protein